MQFLFQTTPIRKKLKTLKRNKITFNFTSNLKAPFAFMVANFTNNILYAFSPMGLYL